MLSKETHFRFKDTNRLNVKEWKKIYHASSNHKTARMTILISDKIDIKTKKLLEIKRIIL